MKKIRIIVAAIVRGALLVSPGTAFAIWQWGKVSALVNILAAVGLETVFLLVFAFVKVAFDVARKRSSVTEDSANAPNAETSDVAL